MNSPNSFLNLLLLSALISLCQQIPVVHYQPYKKVLAFICISHVSLSVSHSTVVGFGEKRFCIHFINGVHDFVNLSHALPQCSEEYILFI